MSNVSVKWPVIETTLNLESIQIFSVDCFNTKNRIKVQTETINLLN
jgi:hypothetical protein